MTWTEDQYAAADMVRPNLRLKRAVLAALKRIAGATGESMSAVVSRLVMAEDEAAGERPPPRKGKR